MQGCAAAWPWHCRDLTAPILVFGLHIEHRNLMLFASTNNAHQCTGDMVVMGSWLQLSAVDCFSMLVLTYNRSCLQPCLCIEVPSALQAYS